MTQILIFAAKLDAEKRWLAAVFTWILISGFCFLFIVQPKLTALKKIDLDIFTKKAQLEAEKTKSNELTTLEKEVQKMQLDVETKKQEKRKSEDTLKSKAAAGAPYLVKFFSTLAHVAKQNGAKFVSIRPVEESAPQGSSALMKDGVGQKAVEISLVGKYSTLAGILLNLEHFGPLSSIKQFYLRESKAGYPFLELKITLGVALS